MKFVNQFVVIYLMIKISSINGCRSRSGSGSTTSSPEFTYTNPSSGQSLQIESPIYAFANEKFTFYVLILTNQDSVFSIDINFGDENYLEINTTEKTIQLEKVYSNVGLFQINVSINNPFFLNKTKTIFVTKNSFSRRYYGISEVGCFNDNETIRDLEFLQETNELKITNDFCGEICFQEKYKFAGTQSGNKCFCGNSYGKYKNGNCSMNCLGNNEQICGDILKNSVYRINYDEVSIDCHPKQLVLEQTTFCEVNFNLQNYSFRARLYYEDIDTTIEENATNETLNLQRTIRNLGYYEFKVNIDELDIYASEYINVSGIKLIDCPTLVQKGEEFNFSLEFFGFDQNVTVIFGDSTKQTVINKNGLQTVNKIIIYKTFTRLGIFNILAYDSLKIFNSTCLINLDGSTLDLNDLNSVLYLLDKKIDLNYCLNNCSGKGICKQFTDENYRCECFEDYTGNTCQLNKHKCIRKPCLNNGNCSETKMISFLTGDVYYEFNCTCPQRYYGTYCEKKKDDYCTNKTCSHSGFCFFNETSEDGECRCFPFYSGNNCEIESSEMKTIKKIISTATIVAIVIIILCWSTFILIDISSIFIKKNNKITPAKKEIKTKPIYIS